MDSTGEQGVAHAIINRFTMGFDVYRAVDHRRTVFPFEDCPSFGPNQTVVEDEEWVVNDGEGNWIHWRIPRPVVRMSFHGLTVVGPIRR